MKRAQANMRRDRTGLVINRITVVGSVDPAASTLWFKFMKLEVNVFLKKKKGGVTSVYTDAPVCWLSVTAENTPH